MKDKNKFKEFMAGLGELYDKEVTPLLIKIYWQTLEPFSDVECENAFNQTIATSKFWPKPVEFLDILQGSGEDKATMAWLEVDKAVRHIGTLASVQFDDPVVHSTIEALGGWESLGNVTEYDWKWIRKDFISMYPRMARKEKHPKRLIGQTERENLGRNYKDFIPETVMIGIPKRLKLAEPHRRNKLLDQGAV